MDKYQGLRTEPFLIEGWGWVQWQWDTELGDYVLRYVRDEVEDD